jgi:phosphoadenosine phosphosulfate reductase
VDAYVQEHDLPVHPLYARGYASIGCFTCTTPIQPGEDRRAGRWRHIREANPDLQAQPIYCGINLEDRKKDL